MYENGAGIGMAPILHQLRRIRMVQQVVLAVCIVVAAGATAAATVGWLIAASATLTAVASIWASAFREQSRNILTLLPFYLLSKKQRVEWERFG